MNTLRGIFCLRQNISHLDNLTRNEDMAVRPNYVCSTLLITERLTPDNKDEQKHNKSSL